ncbi:hypothetical protein RCL_jg25505.t1 [Rhizophagus clarus]|uniref:Uncharacterized protein n=1 Tax=Rhizophagus clarus TaxID=94130 RepID=A0A8H3LJD6_9GLOM|nr:hypothetical protein RCL_jg25505.t1 [Rhizophagus clarus]
MAFSALKAFEDETNREDVCNFWNAIIREKHAIDQEKQAIIKENQELKLATLENEKLIPKGEGCVNRTCGISAC